MLANHVESKRLRLVQVVLKGRVSGRSVDAVRPKALIEGTHFKQKLVVQKESLDSINRRDRNLSHPKVAGDPVIGCSALHSRNLEVIKKWIVGRPKFWIWNW